MRARMRNARGTALVLVALVATACARGHHASREDELDQAALPARTAAVLESAADASATHAGHATFGVPPATSAAPPEPPP